MSVAFKNSSGAPSQDDVCREGIPVPHGLRWEPGVGRRRVGRPPHCSAPGSPSPFQTETGTPPTRRHRAPLGTGGHTYPPSPASVAFLFEGGASRLLSGAASPARSAALTGSRNIRGNCSQYRPEGCALLSQTVLEEVA